MYQQQSGAKLKMNLKGSQANADKKNNTQRRKKVRPGKIIGKIPQDKNIVRFTEIERPLTATRNYKSLLNRYHNQLKRYFRSLFYPEESVSGAFIAKQPSYTNIPTANVTFKEQVYFNTATNGEFNVVWVPNFFATDQAVTTRIGNDSNIYPYAYYSHFNLEQQTILKNHYGLHTLPTHPQYH